MTLGEPRAQSQGGRWSQPARAAREVSLRLGLALTVSQSPKISAIRSLEADSDGPITAETPPVLLGLLVTSYYFSLVRQVTISTVIINIETVQVSESPL